MDSTTNKNDVTLMLLAAIFTSALGMFQFGFNTGVINAPQKVLEEFIDSIYKQRTNTVISQALKETLWSITVGIFAIGGMIGGYFGPKVADKLGRKGGILYNNILAILGVTLMSFSKQLSSFECIILGRFIIGLNCGVYTALVPMYLSEISTLKLRGAIGVVGQLAVTIGLFISQLLGNQEILGTKERWPWLFAFAYVPSIIQLAILPFCPESPRYLLLNLNQESLSRLALRKLRNNNETSVEQEMIEMKNEARVQDEQIQLYGKITSIFELFRHSWLREPLFIAIVMQLSQQLSGINAVFYYSTDIFLTAKIPPNYAGYATMGVGVVMVIMSIVSMPLIDRLGRRSIHLTGLGGMFWTSIILTITLLYNTYFDWIKYTSIVSVLLYTLFFAIGPGPLPWMITSELFTQGARPAAVAVATLVNWSSNFLVGLSFPFIKRVFQDYLFLPYTVMIALIWLYIYYKLPETKNRTFDEISSLFRRPPQTGNKYGAVDETLRNKSSASVSYVTTLNNDNYDNNHHQPDNIICNSTTNFTALPRTNGDNNKKTVCNTSLCSISNFKAENNGIIIDNKNINTDAMMNTWCFYYGYLDEACKRKQIKGENDLERTWCYYYGKLDGACKILMEEDNEKIKSFQAAQTVLVT